MAEPLRHRQTKEAATDMFSLQQPRHIPTLPWRDELGASISRRKHLIKRTLRWWG
jgi:hypothetical protein